MRRPTNISLPTQIHELVVSTYFLKFINKETLTVPLYQAMVTLLNASLNLLIITWNLLTIQTLPSYIKDTTHFLLQLQNLGPLPENAILVTLDVSSLYTNMTHKEGEEACRHSLNTRPLKSIHTERICDLTPMILGINNFPFNGQYFLQTTFSSPEAALL